MLRCGSPKRPCMLLRELFNDSADSGQTNGTMKLRRSVELLTMDPGLDVLEHVATGSVRSCSFPFPVPSTHFKLMILVP